MDIKYVDITEEFISTPPRNIAKELLVAFTFNLEEACASIDIMHEKMDRGMIKYEGLSLPLFRAHVLDTLLPNSILCQPLVDPCDILLFYNRTRQLVWNWYNGYSAADTIMTCLPLQRVDSFQDPILKWLIKSTLLSCYILSDIVQRMHVARSDEFSPYLFNLLTNSSDYDSDVLLQEWERLARLCSSKDVYLMCKVLVAWISVLKRFKSSNCNDLNEMISELDCILESVTIRTSSDDMMQDGEAFIYPVMANYFATGCVRRTILLEPLSVCNERFKKTICNIKDTILLLADGLPSHHQLLTHLLISSSDNSYSAVERSLTFALIIPLYNNNPLLTDALQIACHAPSRQRGLLPKYFKSINKDESDEHVLSRFLAVYYVILGFQLKLYEPFEEVEAHYFISKLSDGHYEEIHKIALHNLRISSHLPIDRQLSTYDDCRYRHRWSCIIDPFHIHEPIISLSSSSTSSLPLVKDKMMIGWSEYKKKLLFIKNQIS